MGKKTERANALQQLLLELEAIEHHPVAINYRDACYMISVSEHIPGHELFDVKNNQLTPWETFARDLRKAIKQGNQIFSHRHGTGDFWLATKSVNEKPRQYEVSSELIKDRDSYLQGRRPTIKRKDHLFLNIKIQEEEDGNVFSEGTESYRLHRGYERNPKLVRLAKEKRKKKDPELHCDICDFSFIKTYGELGDGFIEAHHIRPLSELKIGGETAIEDLAMVCSNCHKMLHRFRPWPTIADIRSLVQVKQIRS